MKKSSATFSRRSFMGIMAAGFGMLAAVPGTIFAAEQAATPTPQAAKKPLVLYYSHSGNTKAVAEAIHKLVGGDILEIKPEKPYPTDYDTLVDQAKKEQAANVRPAVSTPLPDLSQYGVVFLGFPNWWSSMPMPVYTVVEQSKMDGKTIAPFTTHGGGGLGHSVEDLKKLAPHSKILKPLAVKGSLAQKAEKDIEKWLEGLGPALTMTTTGNPAIYPDGGY